MFRLSVIAPLLCLAGCAALSNDTASNDTVAVETQLLSDLQGRYVDLEQTVSSEMASQAELVSDANRSQLRQMQALAADIAGVRRNIEAIEAACATPRTEAAECEAQTVVMHGDRMVVGEKEQVRLVPPGFVLTARVDTGAASSSLHAENLTEFERDGQDWVRFDVATEEVNVTIERPVEKYVRVYQQSDKEGTRRPVIKMRIVLGNVKDTFEFTLADRSHLEHSMLLGRNFLTDIALVDVGRQFVQPLPQP